MKRSISTRWLANVAIMVIAICGDHGHSHLWSSNEYLIHDHSEHSRAHEVII